MNLTEAKNKYTEKKLITFGLTIKQKYKESEQKWKKDLILPNGWITLKLDDSSLTKNNNGLGMLTGEVNSIFVVDIDDVDEWNDLLKQTKHKEPKTVKAISGSGGIHYYFKYTDKLKDITSKDHAIKFNCKSLSIDVKTNGGFIIVSPTTYYNENLKKDVEYKWETDRSIFEHDLKELPEWLYVMFMDKQNHKEDSKKKTKKLQQDVESDNERQQTIDIGNDSIDENTNYDLESDDWKNILQYLNDNRKYEYNDWLQVGQILKNCSHDDKLLELWDATSSKKPTKS